MLPILIITFVKLITWIWTSKCNHNVLAHAAIRRKKVLTILLLIFAHTFAHVQLHFRALLHTPSHVRAHS